MVARGHFILLASSNKNKEVSREFFKRKRGVKWRFHRNWSNGTNETGVYT